MGRPKANPHFKRPGMVGDYRFLRSCDLVLELDEMKVVADSKLLGEDVSRQLYELLECREKRLSREIKTPHIDL